MSLTVRYVYVLRGGVFMSFAVVLFVICLVYFGLFYYSHVHALIRS